jgi:hypothetical protein
MENLVWHFRDIESEKEGQTQSQILSRKCLNLYKK